MIDPDISAQSHGIRSSLIETHLWRIDERTQRALNRLGPAMAEDLDGILRDFYAFLRQFPDTAALLARDGLVEHLIEAQKEHWNGLFRDGVNDDYFRRVQRIGEAHYRVGVRPKVYLSAYSFILDRLVGSVIARNRWNRRAAAEQTGALIRTLLMEAELALSVYLANDTEHHLTDELLELADTFQHELDDAVRAVERKARDMQDAADAVLESARMVGEDSAQVTTASLQTDINAQTIAGAAQELSASIAEISRQVDYSTQAAQDAAQRSQGARTVAADLLNVSERIGAIAGLIEKIAKETRLLALNASIEAVRAGEAGRGFSVVANEVKTLADQTNNATANIRDEIAAMQSAIQNTATTIADVASRVETVSENMGATAAAVVQQEAVTQEIAHNVTQTAASVHQVHGRIGSVAAEAGTTTEISTQLRRDTGELMVQVQTMEKSVVTRLRHSKFAERRRSIRFTVEISATCEIGGVALPMIIEDISTGGARLRGSGSVGVKGETARMSIPDIGTMTAVVEAVGGNTLHLRFTHMEPGTAEALDAAIDGWRRSEMVLVNAVQAAAKQVGDLFDTAIDRGDIRFEALFDFDYRTIPNTDPPQYMTPYAELCDRLLQSMQDTMLQRDTRIEFCAAVDRNGYLPTHNLKYSQPQRPGETAWNAAHSRNRRIFDDFTGISAARNRAPFLVQTYRRDMGGGRMVLMKDISAPIVVHGRHWGALRMGCRTG
jgi:methyl-accepting chemotaxis protein